jgi:type II secretory pathway pseudopilin PulG
MNTKPSAIIKIEHAKRTSAGAAVPAATLRRSQVTHLPLQAAQFRGELGFTLTELLVSIVVVVIIVLTGTQLMTSSTAITRNAHKHIETDTQARVVFDRMALDFAQMLRRTDIDYYVKQRSGYNGHGNGHGWGQGKNGDKGSDQIAFFSAVPGYYPSGYTVGQQSPISLVAYRVTESNSNDPANGRLVRMAKGLGWNALNSNPNLNSPYPIVFLPQTIAGVGKPWAPALNNDNHCDGSPNNSCDPDYEVIGPGVFRFEYFYLLKNGFLSTWPWDWRDDTTNRSKVTDPPAIGLSQVEAIGVAIAAINPEARALIQAASSNAGYGDITDLGAAMADFKNANGLGNAGKKIGDMEDKWKGVVESIAKTGQPPGSGTLFPPEAAKGIRIYTRFFDLKTL